MRWKKKDISLSIVGYILSGDPSYITGHNNARNLVRQVERDDLVEALLKNFLNK